MLEVLCSPSWFLSEKEVLYLRRPLCISRVRLQFLQMLDTEKVPSFNQAEQRGKSCSHQGLVLHLVFIDLHWKSDFLRKDYFPWFWITQSIEISLNLKYFKGQWNVLVFSKVSLCSQEMLVHLTSKATVLSVLEIKSEKNFEITAEKKKKKLSH